MSPVVPPVAVSVLQEGRQAYVAVRSRNGPHVTPELYAWSGDTLRPLHPADARWVGERSSMAQLPYESVRTAAHPRAALLSFLESAYCAGADLGSWDRDDLTSSWCPDPPALRRLIEEGD